MWKLTQMANANKWYNHHIFERIGIPVSKVYFIAVGAPLGAKYNLSSYKESVFLQTATERLCTGGFVLKPLGCDGSSGVMVAEELCSVTNNETFMKPWAAEVTAVARISLSPRNVNCAHAYDASGQDVRVGFPPYGVMLLEKYRAAERCAPLLVLLHTARVFSTACWHHLMPITSQVQLHHFCASFATIQ